MRDKRKCQGKRNDPPAGSPIPWIGDLRTRHQVVPPTLVKGTACRSVPSRRRASDPWLRLELVEHADRQAIFSQAPLSLRSGCGYPRHPRARLMPGAASSHRRPGRVERSARMGTRPARLLRLECLPTARSGGIPSAVVGTRARTLRAQARCGLTRRRPAADEDLLAPRGARAIEPDCEVGSRDPPVGRRVQPEVAQLR